MHYFINNKNNKMSLNSCPVNTSIKVHDDSINLPLDPFDGNKFKLGLYELSTISPPNEMSNYSINLIFSIDCSESMNTICLNGKTKINQVIETLKNILTIISEKFENRITVSIYGFNCDIFTVVELVTISKININNILSVIEQKIIPDSITNFEKILNHINKNEIFTKNYSAHHHLFLSDGQVTDGEDDYNLLCNMLNMYHNIHHTFIGYGEDHDAYLLSKLSNHVCGKYCFIERLDNTGLVYGELLHTILYNAFSNINIHTKGCKIYNYVNNEWTNNLQLGLLSYDANKKFQLKIDSDNIEVRFSSNSYNHAVNDFEYCDLSIYSLRQKVQEYLYISNTDSFHNVAMKTKLSNLLTTITNYMNSNDLNNNPLLISLKEDINISINSNIDNSAYSISRYYSQGNQDSYRVLLPLPEQEPEFVEEYDITQLPPPPSIPIRRQSNHLISNFTIHDCNFNTNTQPDTPINILNMMREINNSCNTEKYE